MKNAKNDILDEGIGNEVVKITQDIHYIDSEIRKVKTFVERMFITLFCAGAVAAISSIKIALCFSAAAVVLFYVGGFCVNLFADKLIQRRLRYYSKSDLKDAANKYFWIQENQHALSHEGKIILTINSLYLPYVYRYLYYNQRKKIKIKKSIGAELEVRFPNQCMWIVYRKRNFEAGMNRRSVDEIQFLMIEYNSIFVQSKKIIMRITALLMFLFVMLYWTIPVVFLIKELMLLVFLFLLFLLAYFVWGELYNQQLSLFLGSFFGIHARLKEKFYQDNADGVLWVLDLIKQEEQYFGSLDFSKNAFDDGYDSAELNLYRKNLLEIKNVFIESSEYLH